MCELSAPASIVMQKAGLQLFAGAAGHLQFVGVDVLTHSFHLLACSDAAAQDCKALQKENVSPDQLASRLRTLQIAPGTAVKPPHQLQPRHAQSLPPKPKQRPLPTPLTVNKAKAPADFKRRREAMAYDLFRQ